MCSATQWGMVVTKLARDLPCRLADRLDQMNQSEAKVFVKNFGVTMSTRRPRRRPVDGAREEGTPRVPKVNVAAPGLG